MAFLDLLKRPDFWKHTLQIALRVLLLMTVLALLMSSFSDILSFDLAAVAEKNFADGKWIKFFGVKVVISLLYAGYLTSKNIK